MAKKTSTPSKTRSKKGIPTSNRICNLVPSTGTERDWKFQDAVQAGALTVARAMPPTEKDLRQDWWKVNDQGSTGSCVGWASTDGVMRYHLVNAGKLDKTALLSPRFTWMASKETDVITQRPETFIEGAGTMLKAAMDICTKYGAVLDSLLPFNISTLMYAGDENAFYAAAAQRRASGYFNLQRNLVQWRSWVANNGPILVGLNVDATWDNATATKGNLDAFQPGTTRGGHAVCIVGYTKDRFIIRNSWGEAWGDKGFAYASEAYINGAFFTESYGVTI